jgi:acyl carrier protein
MWVMDRMAGSAMLSNAPLVLRIQGVLDVEAFERAVATVVDRHESLRTTYMLAGAEAVQVVQPPPFFDFAVVDLTGQGVDACLAATRAEVALGFDLRYGPMMRVRLYRLGETDHVVLIARHHITFDAESDGILLSELGTGYRAYQNGRAPELSDLTVQYPDVALWQRQRLTGARLDRLVGYWRDRLADPPAPAQLPFAVTQRPRESTAGSFLSMPVPPDVAANLFELAHAERATPFMVLLAVLRAVLWRHTGQRDVLVGTPMTGRTRPEVQSLIGCFLNMLVLRGDLSGDPTVRELARRERDLVLGAYEHQELPYSLLVRELGADAGVAMFQVTFSYEMANGSWAPVIEGLDTTALDPDTAVTGHDFNVKVIADGDRLTVHLAYDERLLPPAMATTIAAHFVSCLDEATADPDRRLSQLSPVAPLPLPEPDEGRRLCRMAEGWQSPYGLVPLPEDPAVLDDHGVPVAMGAVGRLHVPSTVDFQLPVHDGRAPQSDPGLRATGLIVRRYAAGLLAVSGFVPAGTSPATSGGGPAAAALAWSTESVGTAPATPLEELVADMWLELLGVRPPDVEVSLFELGGHSLTVTKLAVRMEEEFGLRVGVADLLDNPTVAAQARLVEDLVISRLGALEAGDADRLLKEVSAEPDPAGQR